MFEIDEGEYKSLLDQKLIVVSYYCRTPIPPGDELVDDKHYDFRVYRPAPDSP